VGAIPAAILSIILEIAFALRYRLGAESLLSRLFERQRGGSYHRRKAPRASPFIFLLLAIPKTFDGVLDGIVFGAMIGFGFAMNRRYRRLLYPILRQYGLGAGLINIFLRTVVFGFNHAFWTGCSGKHRLCAVGPKPEAARAGADLRGALAVVMHSLHNIGATWSSGPCFCPWVSVRSWTGAACWCWAF